VLGAAYHKTHNARYHNGMGLISYTIDTKTNYGRVTDQPYDQSQVISLTVNRTKISDSAQ